MDTNTLAPAPKNTSTPDTFLITDVPRRVVDDRVTEDRLMLARGRFHAGGIVLLCTVLTVLAVIDAREPGAFFGWVAGVVMGASVAVMVESIISSRRHYLALRG